MSGEMERIELLNAMSGMAEATWQFFSDLKDQGFSDDQALKIVMTWVRCVMTPKVEE